MFIKNFNIYKFDDHIVKMSLMALLENLTMLQLIQLTL